MGRRLTDRQPNLRVWWDYYRGEPPLPQGPKKESEAYRDFQRKARSNFCLEVADSSVNRLRVIGIADGEEGPTPRRGGGGRPTGWTRARRCCGVRRWRCRRRT
ncbi:hypothetical protein ACFQHO_44910 [Actinomadura yumaensis]|uniref:hypothetical protein n=1 Tax=Actinomadura yumaensis TaxID=111807 RepID=UPI003617AC26